MQLGFIQSVDIGQHGSVKNASDENALPMLAIKDDMTPLLRSTQTRTGSSVGSALIGICRERLATVPNLDDIPFCLIRTPCLSRVSADFSEVRSSFL
jgi:hypothetical protein